MNKEVSIVIIGRNEECAIEKCITAAQAAARQIGGAEIIYVDSASTDKTVEVVRRTGVEVVALSPDQKLCPSAGRHAGTSAANGEFILFLDADTLIYQDFLPAAIEHFRLHPDLAGVNGRIDDTDDSGILFENVEVRFDEIVETEWLRGPACFYRRAALNAVGSFDPRLMVEEEAELGLRLIKNGWRMNLLPIPMACHTRCYHNQTFSSIFSAVKRDFRTGRLGEVFVTALYAFRQGFGLRFCRLRLKTTIIFAALMMLGSTCLFLPVNLHPIEMVVLIFCCVFFIVWQKKRSLYQTLLFFPAKSLCLIDVAAGVLKTGMKMFEI